MERVIGMIKVYVSFFIGILWYLIGDVNNMFKLLLFFILLDIVTGLSKALINKTLSSKVFFEGGYKKALIFIVIMIANMIDKSFTDIFLRETTIVYYIINEGISVIENIGEYIELPPQITQFFIKLQGDEENDK